MPLYLTGLNENVSTYDSAGGKDYSTLTGWEGDTDVDLVTAQVTEVLEVYAGTHNDTVQLNGATCDQYYKRIIRAASGEGYIDSNNAIPVVDGSVAAFVINKVVDDIIIIFEDYSILEGLVMTDIYGADTSKGFNLRGNNSVAYKCAGIDFVAGFQPFLSSYSGVTDHQVYFVNCLASGTIVAASSGFKAGGAGTNVASYFLNCTGYGNYYNFLRGSGDTAIAVNCVSEQAVSANWSGTWSKTNCTDNDGVTFVNAAGDDYKLDLTDSAALDQGTDASAYGYSDDVLGNVRPNGPAWDIGFHEAQLTVSPSVNDTVGINESTSVFDILNLNKSEAVLVTENFTTLLKILISKAETVTLAENIGIEATLVREVSVYDATDAADVLNTFVTGYLINGTIRFYAEPLSLNIEAEAL